MAADGASAGIAALISGCGDVAAHAAITTRVTTNHKRANARLIFILLRSKPGIGQLARATIAPMPYTSPGRNEFM
jgi:hypothetical protein